MFNGVTRLPFLEPRLLPRLDMRLSGCEFLLLPSRTLVDIGVFEVTLAVAASVVVKFLVFLAGDSLLGVFKLSRQKQEVRSDFWDLIEYGLLHQWCR